MLRVNKILYITHTFFKLSLWVPTKDLLWEKLTRQIHINISGIYACSKKLKQLLLYIFTEISGDPLQHSWVPRTPVKTTWSPRSTNPKNKQIICFVIILHPDKVFDKNTTFCLFKMLSLLNLARNELTSFSQKYCITYLRWYVLKQHVK